MTDSRKKSKTHRKVNIDFIDFPEEKRNRQK